MVVHDEETRLAVDDVLAVLDHPYELTTDLTTARGLLAADEYSYVLADYRLPARPGPCQAHVRRIRVDDPTGRVT